MEFFKVLVPLHFISLLCFLCCVTIFGRLSFSNTTGSLGWADLLILESIRKDYDEAMRDASERISKLQDVAVRSGYAKEDLKTTSFNVDTRYESVKR